MRTLSDRLEIRMNKRVKEKFFERAKLEGLTPSKLIRQVIDEIIKEHESKQQ